MYLNRNLDTHTEWDGLCCLNRQDREIAECRKLAYSQHRTDDRAGLVASCRRSGTLRTARILGYGFVAAIALIIAFA